ncbi:MAG TPA: carboxymuconolactone decarboxylase family protein [Acidimicrobiales bacterium]|nr:carboxymuconolactone decarboxylase family protein [Acidimicrobiales bacterium]
MESNDDIRSELRQPARDLRDLIPDVWKGHVETSAAALRDGALSAQAKELIALVVAVTRECDGCIVAHARGAARQLATRQMVAEAMGVAISMNGGPGTVWGPRALRAFDEAVAERAQRSDPATMLAT